MSENRNKKTACKEVLVVGADHRNTLGIIRALGKENYIVHLIIHGDDTSQTVKCSKSKYFNGVLLTVKSEEGALLDSLLSLSKQTNSKPVAVIPTTDFATLCIDKNYNVLSKLFILPSINGEQGKIVHYMNKYAQKELAEQYGIFMAKSIKINLLNSSDFKLPDEWKYPCILKPNISAEGKKSDIAIVHTEEELNQKISDFKDKQYSQVLLQEFIEKDYELCVVGCITGQSKRLYYGTLKKIREYPYSGGSTSYAKLVRMDEVVLPIINVLQEIGYSGLFDIEIFMVSGKAYLNEINFRSSANNWAVVHDGLNISDIWVRDIQGDTLESIGSLNMKKVYFMNETSDIHYLFDKKINFLKWIRDLFRTRTFNKFWLHDIRGTLVWYKRR